MKSMYGFIRDAWKKPERSYVKSLMWQRLQTWRREPSVVRIERPTRLDRARAAPEEAKWLAEDGRRLAIWLTRWKEPSNMPKR